MDELIDSLLQDDIFCDVTLPRISKRHVLEEEGVLEPYQSALNIQEDDLEPMDDMKQPEDNKRDE